MELIMVSKGFVKQLDGYRLATAEIVYHLPDFPTILQSYIWQDFDLSPEFPILRKFLNFWQLNLDGKIYTVTVGTKSLIEPADVQVSEEISIH